MQIEEPRSHMTATGEPVQDEGFRVLPTVTEEVFYRCMNFRVAPVHKALVSASKVCRKGYRIILDSGAWTKWHASQTHERMDRVARRNRCLRFRWLGFSGNGETTRAKETQEHTPTAGMSTWKRTRRAQPTAGKRRGSQRFPV